MSYIKSEGTFLSADRKTEVHYVRYIPEGNPIAILQISHGMCEHLGRYELEGFVSALTEQGIVVCGNDHLGHGQTASSESELGYFEDYRNLVDDLHTLNGILRKTYPRLPYVLFGHSMGSFLARAYMVTYSDVDGVILCGTSAGNQPLGLAKALASMIAALRGDHHRSKLLRALSFAGYNKAFAAERDGNSWLSALPAVRARYRDDEKSGFLFTATAYRELFKLLAFVSSDDWAREVPLSLPVFLIAGDADPVGDNGEGVKEVYGRLEDHELNELKMKLYPGGRHEIHNDLCREEVMADVVAWIREVAEGVVACRSYESFPFGRLVSYEEAIDGH